MGIFGKLFRDKSRDDEFCRLCESGSASEVKAALESWGVPEAKNNEGKTVLMCAAEHNREAEVIEVLLQSGAKINAKTGDNITALMLAVKAHNMPAVRKLLAAGASVNEKDSDGKTALHYAALENFKHDIFSLLIQSGANVDTRDSENKTLLMNFAGSGQDNSHIIKYLVQSGADVNAEDSNMTVLMYAIRGGCPGNITAITDSGADINKKTSDGRTALFYASGLKSPNSANIIRFLLDNGADVDSFRKGEFALDHALNSGNQEAADVLRAAGGIRNFYKLCMDGTAQEVLTELRTGRINVNTVYDKGTTPLMLSLHNKDIDVFKLLIEAGANINACAKFFPKGMCSVLDMAKIMQVSPFGAMKQRVNILRSLGAISLHPEIWK